MNDNTKVHLITGVAGFIGANLAKRILNFENENYKNCKIVRDVKSFKKNSSIIIANRIEEELEDVMGKVYTRNVYFRD